MLHTIMGRTYDPDYLVSIDGRVMSLDREIDLGAKGVRVYPSTVIKPNLTHNGYHRVQLSKGHRVMVHRLVLLTFKGDYNGLETDHINANKIDNRLEMVTRSENQLRVLAKRNIELWQ